MEASNVDIIVLSNFLTGYSAYNGENITQLKLQKLLYYVQAWHMVHINQSNTLFADQPEAWVNGPVYEKVYRYFAGSKDAPIRISNDPQVQFENALAAMNLNEQQQMLIYSVHMKYAKLSDAQLVFQTHCEGPWIEARGATPPFARSHAKISFETMYAYYSAKLK